MEACSRGRGARGGAIQGNYTWAHCIDDGYDDVVQTTTGGAPDRRGLNRGNCELDRRQNFNMSTVYETPQFANTTLRMLGTGWRISGIVRALTGTPLNVTTGLTSLGYSPTSMDERPRQILDSPYASDKSIALWLSPAAFATPILRQ